MSLRQQVNFEPFKDFVVIEPIAAGLTAGGLALPEENESVLPKGIVRAVGRGIMVQDGSIEPPQAEVGDVVFLVFGARDRALPFEDGGKTYILMRAIDIVGRVPKVTEDAAPVAAGGGE